MKKRVVVVILVLGFSIGGIFTLLSAAVDNSTESVALYEAVDEGFPLPEKKGVYTNRRTDGVENSYNQSIFGPKACTAFGDPYSPLNSIWKPGIHTYQYRILIPADYGSNKVRIELFDPDSINNNIITTTITHTQLADSLNFPLTESASCNSGQRDTCVLDTDEASLLSTHPELSYDQLNPFWMVRIDENRGDGEGDGNGRCRTPQNYTPRYNTQTIYELSYNALDSNGVPKSTMLARYTGQTGDGVRDNGNHKTDMHWVSPGAPSNFDQPASVPVDGGSPGTFEVNLNQDVPNIITNPLTGERELFLNVTAVGGASENGFDIWAGPPSYINTVPSQVNDRNVYVINNPQSHDSDGIVIFALETLPQNSNIDIQLELPITYLGPEYAGQVISITAYDLEDYDPFFNPIDFYMDTIAETDWSLTYGQNGITDPDGIAPGVRCLPGSCSDIWIEPAYQLELPEYGATCGLNNQDPQECTPFYGGRLMARFRGGNQDTYVWEAYVPEAPILNNSDGCTNAFPIGLNFDSQSVSGLGIDPGTYPNPGDFDYPPVPPSYASFISHKPNIPIIQAQEGYLYRLYDGSGTGDFSWLRWSTGEPNTDAGLAGNLTWPGKNDLSLNVEDFIPGKSSPLTNITQSGVVQAELNDHIDNRRTLRMVIWDTQNGGQYSMAGVGIFRLVGYNMEAGAGNSWLLLEFIDWDTSCGQIVVGLTGVSISGPIKGYVNTPYNFLATIAPIAATQPVTYTWVTDGQAPVVQINRFQDDLLLKWSTEGNHQITVTANNKAGDVVQDTYTIELVKRKVFLPAILKK